MVTGLARLGPAGGHHQIIQTNSKPGYAASSNSSDRHEDPNRILVASYLYKKSSTTHQYKKYWFVLRVGQLAQYKDSQEHKPINVIDSSTIVSVGKVEKQSRHPHFVIYTANKKLKLYSDTEEVFESWKSAIEALTEPEKTEKPTERPTVVPLQPPPPPQVQASRNDSSHEQFSGTEDPNYTSCASESTPMPTVVPPLDVIQESLSPINSPPRALSEIQFGSEARNEILIEQGYLSRLYKTYSQWKRFRILLTNKQMYFYKPSSDKPIKTINLDDIMDICELDPLSKTKIWCLLIITKKKRIRFCADNEEELLKWIVAIKTVVNKKKKTRASTA